MRLEVAEEAVEVLVGLEELLSLSFLLRYKVVHMMYRVDNLVQEVTRGIPGVAQEVRLELSVNQLTMELQVRFGTIKYKLYGINTISK
jgi:hypothetical protein